MTLRERILELTPTAVATTGDKPIIAGTVNIIWVVCRKCGRESVSCNCSYSRAH